MSGNFCEGERGVAGSLCGPGWTRRMDCVRNDVPGANSHRGSKRTCKGIQACDEKSTEFAGRRPWTVPPLIGYVI